jgi:hypothetical protein
MSSPQYPVLFLCVTTALCCTFIGCASKLGPRPDIADSTDMDTTRDGFLTTTSQTDARAVPTPGLGPVLSASGSPLDPQSINDILDEMLAGHEALQSRMAQETTDPLAGSKNLEAPSLVVQVASVDPLKPSEALSLAGSLVIDAPALEDTSNVVVDLPRIEPTTEMIRSLLASAARSDAPLKQHLALAMLMAWVSPEKPFEPAGLSELTEQERAVVSIVYEHFKSLGTTLDDGGGEADLLTALTGIIDAVEGESPFQISRMELCSWVRDFGDIDVIEPLTFSPKERPRFIWYVELDGVDPTQSATTGEWAHEFDVKVEILTKDTGIPVISPVEDRVRYASSSRLRDLFLRNILEIPEDLQFDWYTTKVTITEVTSGIRSQKSLDLLWVPNLAAGEAHFLRQAAVEE